MKYTIFSKKNNNQIKEPMFFGQSVNIVRYDQQKYPIFEQLIEKQLSFFWRPEEIDISKDRIDYQLLNEHEKHIFISNLKYQILLDSIQGRSPNIALLPIVSLPELETWIETWSFSETIHSRSYTYIIRNIINNPSIIFDNIINNQQIINRANDITYYYDNLIKTINFHYLSTKTSKSRSIELKTIKKQLYLCLISVNALESIRFYVSFACAFAFAERKLMEGNAKIIKLIARDEALHVIGTQHIINIMQSGIDDPEMAKISKKYKKQCQNIFIKVAEQEKTWVKYLFSNGSMVGLNKNILYKYIEYITNVRMQAIKLNSPFKNFNNPIPWINSWLISDNVQVAAQEAELSSYLVGQINTKININTLKKIKL